MKKSQEKILIEILREIKTKNAIASELWDAKDIAYYMRLSRSSIQSRILTRIDFPRALVIPTSGSGGGRRWYSKEVREWLGKNREPLKK